MPEDMSEFDTLYLGMSPEQRARFKGTVSLIQALSRESARAPHVVVDLVAGASTPSGRTSDLRAHPPGAPAAFDSLAFIADGPLALFGPPARLRLPLLRFWRQIANIARKGDLQPPVIPGIEKSGEFVDHADDLGDLIERGAPPAAARRLHPGVRQRPPRRLWGRHILR